MKVLSTALLLLATGLGAEGAKNPHGFDPAFLKAMTQGAKKSAFLKDVTNYERKQFWRNLLKKAKPAASVEGGLRASAAKEGKSERKLANGNYNYNQYNGQNNNNANNGNGNGNQYANQNYNNGQDYYKNGQYNYGGNNVNYNYNGGMNQYNEDGSYNGEYEYDEEYWESLNSQQYGVDWSNLGFDMRQYSLKYTGCSAVKSYNSYKAQSGEDDVLSTKRFALFRLCPSNNCNKYSVNGCGRNYGEYVLEMDSFLEGVVEFNRQRYWHYCHFCRRCNGLESYGERMSELSEEQMEYYEEMQAEAEAYYEAQQEQYQQENQDYANENAANYNYYNQYNQNNKNNGQYNQNYAQNNNNANYNNYDGENVNGNGNNRKVRKLMVPKTLREMRQLSNNYNNNGNNNNGDADGSNYNNAYSSAQRYYYQNQKRQQYQNGEIDYDEYQSSIEQMNQNMYNAYYWDESIYGEWDEDWNEAWLAFNWQVLPYCSESELEACQDAETMCEDYDENYEEEQDEMGGFSACTQIDNNLYIGPHCNSDGFTITLGVYSDEYCDTYVGDEVSLYDVLGYDIGDQFDFFPQECVSCEEGGEEREFVSFMEANEDFDNYEEWLDTRWQEYIEMTEEMYEQNNGDAQNQYYQTAQAYYQAQNYQNGNQQGYYYQNGNQYQNGGGAYYYNQNQNGENQYARYGGEYYQNKQMAESYGNYGGNMLNYGMNYYYNRNQAGDWITNEMYDKDEWQQEQQADYGDYYWYRNSQKVFAKSGIADVCGALYTYAAKCNKHLSYSSGDYNAFQYSYGSEQQAANEEQVCNFIDNLQTQKYDEYGDIVLDASQVSKGYVIDFAGTNWRDPDQVKAQAEKTGVTAGQAAGLALTLAACMVMGVWACCLHSTLARKNIPWRPKRGKLTEPTDIARQNSGIVMGRSRSGMSGKATPLI